MTEQQLDSLFRYISKYTVPAPYGPEDISLNHGIHLSGGDPFLNYELLLKAVDLAKEYEIPSVFVETNCFWCLDDQTTRERFLELKAAGMHGVMISVNPFYLEFVPFERTERAIRIAHEIFGNNLAVYQTEYYRRFIELGISGTVKYKDYLKIEPEQVFMCNVEFFLTGRPICALSGILDNYYPRYEAEVLLEQPCRPDFVRPWHNHFDNYSNYMPSYCAELSYGNWNDLDHFVGTEPDPDEKPVLSMIIQNDFKTLLEFSRNEGCIDDPAGYFSKCHLCVDIRKYLSENGDYKELSPLEYYKHFG